MRDPVEKFDDVPLDVIDKFRLRTHINHLVTFRSQDRVLQARAYLKLIFAEAMEQEFLYKDPSRNVTVKQMVDSVHAELTAEPQNAKAA